MTTTATGETRAVLGTGRTALAVLIPLFIGCFGHFTSIVAYSVTGISACRTRATGWPRT
jgi:hypothetical protein